MLCLIVKNKKSKYIFTKKTIKLEDGIQIDKGYGLFEILILLSIYPLLMIIGMFYKSWIYPKIISKRRVEDILTCNDLPTQEILIKLL